MQRSEVNRLQREALALFAEHRFALPPFATWSEAEWRNNPEAARYCLAHQMGWDITDFGSNDFPRRGLVDLLRQERPPGRRDEKPYAEKLLVVREEQETPYHHHRIKMEDIIVPRRRQPDPRARTTTRTARSRETPVTVMVDGTRPRARPRRAAAAQRPARA